MPQHATDQWYAATAGTGSFHLKIDFRPIRDEAPLTIEAFDLLKVIGKGSFGKVMQVRKKDTQRIYALKTIRKGLHLHTPSVIANVVQPILPSVRERLRTSLPNAQCSHWSTIPSSFP